MSASPRPGAPPLSIDICGQCSGFWLDGAELAPALPALGGLPHRLSAIAQVAVPGSFACPRCRGLMLAFDLLETPIDLCRDCHGVWLDGGEIARLAAAASEPRPARRELPKEVRCSGCGAQTPLASTYYSDRGLVCAACHQTTDSLEAIQDRGAQVRQAYAEYEARQGRIMAQNRAMLPPRNLEEELQDMRRDLDWLRRHAR
jgi:Zn-finger nucleic acid-binding protein